VYEMEWSALGNGNGTEREEESNKKRSEYQIDGLDGNMFHQLGGRWRKGRNIPRGEKRERVIFGVLQLWNDTVKVYIYIG
jgi:hypothetical protein